MKKILCFAIIAFLAMSPVAFGWTVDSGGADGLSSGSIGSFKASKNVNIVVHSGSQSYAASAGHTSGDKAYGVASDSSVVMVYSKTKGDAWDGTGMGNASDHTAFGTGWTSM